MALPAYALTLLLLTAAMVPSNWVSRRMEAQADRASLELTGDRRAFIRSEVRIAHENLSEVLPPAWVEFLFYTHPCNARRILLAEGP
jgi:STE24 endopeptidase